MGQHYYASTSEHGLLIWDVDRLIELSKGLPQQEIPLNEIQELDEVCWFDPEGDRPTTRAVAEHAELIMESDLRFPIILSADGRVMDGLHRVAKAYMKDRQAITAVQFEETPEPDQIVTE